MNPQAAQNYLRTKVLTATPEQLQLMLYDGAIRFAEQAKPALLARKFDESHSLISRVQKILTELSSSLKHDVAPDLCQRLAALYTYTYKLLISASIKHDVKSLDEALKILKFQRDTWAMLLDQLGKQNAAAFATRLDMPAPSARMEASISMHG